MCDLVWLYVTDRKGGETMKKITKIEPAATTKKKRKRRVAAYCRVSTATEDQLVSLEVQKAHYEEYITAHPD